MTSEIPNPADNTPASGWRQACRRWWPFLLPVVGALLVFGQVVRHDFVAYDDPDYVSGNLHVKKA